MIKYITSILTIIAFLLTLLVITVVMGSSLLAWWKIVVIVTIIATCFITPFAVDYTTKKILLFDLYFSLHHKQDSRIKDALEVAAHWSQISGSHHKAWAIDQMVRYLLGDKYDLWIEEYEAPDEEGDHYEWDVGISP